MTPGEKLKIKAGYPAGLEIMARYPGGHTPKITFDNVYLSGKTFSDQKPIAG